MKAQCTCQRDFVPSVTLISSIRLEVWSQRLCDNACGIEAISPISLDTGSCVYVIVLTVMARRPPPRREDAKVATLRASGTLHPDPEVVRDDAFASGTEFFDRRDRLQVKYEMLRRHRVDGRPVTEVAPAFGVSRQAYYAAAQAFEAQGLAGLLSRPRGPQRAHKCTDAILDFVERWQGEHGAEEAAESAADAVARRFGVALHPRSLDRALARRKKNGAARRRLRHELSAVGSARADHAVRGAAPGGHCARRSAPPWSRVGAVRGAGHARLARR